MIKVHITQVTTDMINGKINYYYNIEGDDVIRNFSKVGYYTVSLDYWQEIFEKIEADDEVEADAEIARLAFKNTYPYFRIYIGGEDVTPERKKYNECIREDLESKDYTLDQLYEMLEKENNIFKKTTGLARITAKYKTIIINELIYKAKEEIEINYELV